MSDQKRRYRLKKIRLDEISLVDVPAEPNSTVTIFKRAETPLQETTMKTIEQLTEEMRKAAETLTAQTKRAEEAEAKIADLTKRAEAAEAKLAAAPKGAPSEDDVLKGADPAVAAEIRKLREANAAASRQLADMVEEREIRKFAERIAVDYKHLPFKADEFAPILKRATAPLSEADAKELHRVLKAADEAMARGMLAVHGAGGEITKNSAEAALEAKAREIEASDKVSFAKAYTLATERFPDLYTQYQNERAAAH